MIKDEYAVGPLGNIYEPEGFQARKAWWANALEYSPYTDQLDIVDDKMTVHQLKKKLTEDESETVWIWMGQNQHDVCGYYWLLPQLVDFQGRVNILYLNNLPFINAEGGIFYPKHLFEIRPKEFLKAQKLARPITLRRRQTLRMPAASACRRSRPQATPARRRSSAQVSSGRHKRWARPSY